MASGFQFQNVKSAVQSRARWVGREAGSAARELLDELPIGRPPPRQIAYGHRGVAEAIRCGWADIGICLRLVSDEAGLGFLTVREEEYDYCYPAEFEGRSSHPGIGGYGAVGLFPWDPERSAGLRRGGNRRTGASRLSTAFFAALLKVHSFRRKGPTVFVTFPVREKSRGDPD